MDTLVRLSASIINGLKRDMPNQSTKDGVEKVYLMMFDACLSVDGMHSLVSVLEDLEKNIYNSEYEN